MEMRLTRGFLIFPFLLFLSLLVLCASVAKCGEMKYEQTMGVFDWDSITGEKVTGIAHSSEALEDTVALDICAPGTWRLAHGS